MAKFSDLAVEHYCPQHKRMVTVAQHTEENKNRRLNGNDYQTTECYYIGSCGCRTVDQFIHCGNTTKETPVTKVFDTNTVTNTALNNVVGKVHKLELALFARAEALAKVDAEHTKQITEASLALDRVLIEAWQSGVNMEEYDNFLPDYADKLQPRLEEVVGIMSLANAEFPV